MPSMLFDERPVELSTAGYVAALHALAGAPPGERRDVLLDILYDEGLLCDVCGDALATTQARQHRDTQLCATCAGNEPCPAEGEELAELPDTP